MTPPADPGSWLLRPPADAQAAVRLFCLPYAGGSAGTFRPWARALPASVAVCAVQLPGRERRIREPAYDQLDPLVEAIAAALAGHLDRPFALFGHSMGSLLAFELARRLRHDHGKEPVRLFVGGRHAPHLPDPDPPIHHLPDPEFVDGVRRFNGMPEEVLDSPELMELILPTLRADFTLVETYEYREEPPLGCPISVFGGLADDWTPRPSLEAWGEQTRGTSLLRMLPGDHFFVETSRDLILQSIHRDLQDLFDI